MRWRLTYVVRTYGTSEDSPLWRDSTRTWNIEGVESDGEAAEKAKVFLEKVVLRVGHVERFDLVRIVQEEVTVPVAVSRIRAYGELKRPQKAYDPHLEILIPQD